MQWTFSWPTAKGNLKRAARYEAHGKLRQAFRAYARAARTGSAEAAFRVGRTYLEGRVVPISRADAARWLERAAGHGHVEAQVLLAELLLQGLIQSSGAPQRAGPSGRLFEANAIAKPDHPAALRWARLAAEAGSPEGQVLLAHVLSRGPEPLRDPAAAREWYRRSAAGGSAHGALGYALAIADEPGREREAAYFVKQAADRGLPAAQFLFGRLTEQGVGMPSNPQAAAELYRQAAEGGHTEAQAYWGGLLVDGRIVAQDPVSGESWLRRAALAGHAEAAARVGQIYAAPGPLPPNYAEAAIWLERAAHAGHGGAARSLGLLYLRGAGVPRDSEEAVYWLRTAAGAGDRQARDHIAKLVIDGQGSSDDLAKVVAWFREAADAGDHFAEFNYAICLARGLGVPRDDTEAAAYLRRSSRHVPAARYWYGLMLCEGRGVTRNLVKARRHLRWPRRLARRRQPQRWVKWLSTAVGDQAIRSGPSRYSARQPPVAMPPRSSPWVFLLPADTGKR